MLNKRGFTLIEVLIVLLIVGLLAGLAANRIANSYRAEARALSWRMASTIKYLYNTAATENKTVRLVFDFETNSYWAEATSERFLLEKAEEADKKGLVKPDEKEKKGEETKTEKEGEDYVKPLEPTFGTIDSPLLETRELPKGILLKDVYTSHDVAAVAIGRAYIYFFPNGYSEPAVVNFRDAADEKHLSIKINPFNGNVDIGTEYRNLEGEKVKVKK